jgi:hypothetical protein
MGGHTGWAWWAVAHPKIWDFLLLPQKDKPFSGSSIGNHCSGSSSRLCLSDCFLPRTLPVRASQVASPSALAGCPVLLPTCPPPPPRRSLGIWRSDVRTSQSVAPRLSGSTAGCLAGCRPLSAQSLLQFAGQRSLSVQHPAGWSFLTELCNSLVLTSNVPW